MLDRNKLFIFICVPLKTLLKSVQWFISNWSTTDSSECVKIGCSQSSDFHLDPALLHSNCGNRTIALSCPSSSCSFGPCHQWRLTQGISVWRRFWFWHLTKNSCHLFSLIKILPLLIQFKNNPDYFQNLLHIHRKLGKPLSGIFLLYNTGYVQAS